MNSVLLFFGVAPINSSRLLLDESGRELEVLKSNHAAASQSSQSFEKEVKQFKDRFFVFLDTRWEVMVLRGFACLSVIIFVVCLPRLSLLLALQPPRRRL